MPDRADNETQWSGLPELEGLNIVQGLNESALELLSTADGDPVLAVENIDEGKVAAFLSDSSWKWNFSQASEGKISPLYDKFWNRLFLWLVNDPDLSDIKISTDKSIYNPGDEAKIEVRALSPEIISENSHPVVTSPGGKEETIEIKRENSNSYSGQTKLDENGVYKISIAPDRENAIYEQLNKSATIFTVEPLENEVKGPTANIELLKLIAQETGGKYITTEESLDELSLDPSKKKTITGYKTRKLWDNPFYFLLIIGMLSAEWILRRRWGLK